MLLAWPRHASSQVAVGVDAGATYEPSVGWGLGFDGRLGYRFGLPREAILHSLIMQVEAIAGQMFLAPWANPVAVERFGGGLRLGWLLDEVEPFAFAHISAAANPNGWGYLGDVGGALDWRLRTFSLGLHATHSWLSSTATGKCGSLDRMSRSAASRRERAMKALHVLQHVVMEGPAHTR